MLALDEFGSERTVNPRMTPELQQESPQRR